jgi:hypothetical protein
MTAAQKTAKLKFKQAIAYRQKTGVSLKEAFAHIYGKKKVGAVKKKAAPKKKAAKKVVRKVVKKAAPKKKAAKKVVKRTTTNIAIDKRYKAKKAGKRTSASGNTYYESRPNRSDRGKLLGIGNVKTNLFNNLSDLKIFHKKEGGHWFDSQTMKYFNTKIESALLGGKYFIYSTKMPNYDRTFQIAEAYPSGNIFPVDNSPHFKDKTQAKIYLLKLLKL